MRVVEIAHVQVLGSVEDEKTLSSLSFLKSKLRNRHTTHLDLAVRMFAQGFYTLNTFPYQVPNVESESLEGLLWRGRVNVL